MRIHTLIIAVFFCSMAGRSMAQNEAYMREVDTSKYRPFAIYAGVGPSYFFNNVIAFKNDVTTLGYACTFRFMWEPRGSFLSLGIESGYNRQYSANSNIVDSSSGQTVKAHVTNSAVPVLFVVSMRFSSKLYADWSMGQSFNFNNVTTDVVTTNHDAKTTSLADFSATIGYRFIQKPRFSYAAEFKGYYSSSYSNGTIAVLFVVGYRL